METNVAEPVETTRELNTAGEKFVSVVIPTYNMAQFLPISIESVLSQTYRNLELIVVDDGSQDNTAEVVEPFYKDSRFRYHLKANGGDASARNEGIRLAKADYIAFLDADDVWYRDKLERQMPLFEEEAQPGLVFSHRDLIDEHGNPVNGWDWKLYRGSDLYRRLLIQNFVPTSSAIVARRVFDEVGCFDESIRYVSDRDFWIRASVAVPFDYISDALEAKRKWSVQMTSNKLAFAEASLGVITRFVDRHPELVDRDLATEIWSAAYARRGAALSERGERRKALGDLAYALWQRPTNGSAWKSLVKLLIGRSE